MSFEKLNLRPDILKAVKSRGYTEPTPIQAQAIPAVLEGRDVLAGAQTGTGKTAAFALPVLELLSKQGQAKKNPRVLVLTPTRELAAQVGESFEIYGKNLPFRSVTVFGGVKINPQIQLLRKGCDVLVATPGRLLDHLQQKTVDLRNIEILILDEADRMLDMGFIRDIKKILSHLPEARQNLLFSATYDKEVKKLCKTLLRNPISVEVNPQNQAAEKVEQIAYKVEKRQKRHLLAYLIKKEAWYQVLVFVRTKHGANRLAKQLAKEDIPSAAIHGDKSQGARTRALKEFKSGDLQALIATNVAARGLDLKGLSHVVNYDLPQMPEDYVHRIGRTGRAGESGHAVSLITEEDVKQLRAIEKLTRETIPLSQAEGFVPVAMEATSHTGNSAASGRRPSGSPNGNRGNNSASSFRGRRSAQTEKPSGSRDPRRESSRRGDKNPSSQGSRGAGNSGNRRRKFSERRGSSTSRG